MADTVNISELIDSFKSKTPGRKRLVSEFKEALEENGWSPNTEAVGAIIDRYNEQKKRLRGLFSRHPLWSHKDQAIIDTVHETKRIDVVDALTDFFAPVQTPGIVMPDWVIDKTTTGWRKIRSLSDSFTYIIRTLASNYLAGNHLNEKMTISSHWKNFLSANGYESAKVGQKISRTIAAWAKETGYDRYPGYNKLFAALSDSLNPYDRTRKLVISINPVAILLMSVGKSWDTCHGIQFSRSHCAKSGSLSYIMDTTSFMVYTIPDACSPSHNINTEPKLNRQMWHFHDGRVIQSRMYPEYQDTTLSSAWRPVVLDALTTCLNFPCKWQIMDEGQRGIIEQIESVDGSTHYRDYVDSCYKAVAIRLVNAQCGGKIEIGHKALCICCSDEHSDAAVLDCCNYPRRDPDAEETDYDYYCESCGDGMWDPCYTTADEDGDEPLCEDCIAECYDCGNVFHAGDTRPTMGPSCRTVCVSCWEVEHYICQNCSHHYKKTDENQGQDVQIHTTSGHLTEVFCPKCVSLFTKHCEQCNSYYAMGLNVPNFHCSCVAAPQRKETNND
jgi:hypothetical protein